MAIFTLERGPREQENGSRSRLEFSNCVTPKTDADKTEELLFYLQDGMSAEHHWDGGMIGQSLCFERIGSVLTFSMGKNDLASCDVRDFMEALLELLVSYESAVELG